LRLAGALAVVGHATVVHGIQNDQTQWYLSFISWLKGLQILNLCGKIVVAFHDQIAEHYLCYRYWLIKRHRTTS
jgi:hypothetical protein